MGPYTDVSNNKASIEQCIRSSIEETDYFLQEPTKIKQAELKIQAPMCLAEFL